MPNNKSFYQEVFGFIYSFLKWTKQTISEEQLHDYILVKIGVGIGIDIPNFNYPEEKLQRIEKYVNAKSPSHLELIKVNKEVWNLLKITFDELKRLFNSKLTKKQVDLYIGSMCAIYIRQNNSVLNGILFLSMFINASGAKKDADKKNIKEFFSGNTYPDAYLEKIGDAILSLFYRPHKVFQNIYNPFIQIKNNPKPFLAQAGSNLLEIVKKEAEPHIDEKLLQHVSGEAVNYSIGDSSVGEINLESKLDLSDFKKPEISLNVKGHSNINKELSDLWTLYFDANFEEVKVLLIFFEIKNSIVEFPDNASAKIIFSKTKNKSNEIATQTNFDLGQFNVSLFIAKDQIELELNLSGNKLALAKNDTDSFVASSLSSKGSKINLDLNMLFGFSKGRGIYFEGASGLRYFKQLSKKIGIIKVHHVLLEADIESAQTKSALKAKASTAFNFNLGPIVATVEEIGVETGVLFPKEGHPELLLDYLPPKGVGLKINSPLISGGGFLDLDYDNHQYVGALALSFWKIELAAIGLINTRLPNKQKGFSMLINLSVLFKPAIQLAFGFTLKGVGGLIGIHRTMKVDVLREKIRNGSIGSIMFPKKIIENAPRIISDLRAVFPPQRNHFVLAPFFKIGFGTPTIVEIDLGVLVEMPYKGRVILIGNIGVFLPSKKVKKKLVEINVDVFGDFNFSESFLLLEGRLRDSQIVGIKLKGGFAFVLDWGQRKQFLFSIGGYHPKYKKPARFPEVPRLSAIIKKGNSFRLTCKYYQAITSNSFQLGMSAEIFVKKGKANARGFLGFNTLIKFDPFYFEADIKINVDIKYGKRNLLGVDLYFLLSGPKPWHAKGYAKVKVLFFSLKVRFNISWGGKQKVLPRSIEPDFLLDQLKLQLEAVSNWSDIFPNYYRPAESLRNLEEEEQQGKIVMHPFGALELRQNLIPLNRTIEKLGNTTLNKRLAYEIKSFQLGNGEVIENNNRRRKITDYFSRGQFEELTDSEKLSAADFNQMTSGIKLHTGGLYDISEELEWTSNGFEDVLLEGKKEEEPRARGLTLKENYNWQEESNLIKKRHSGFSDSAKGFFQIIDELPDYDEKQYQILTKDTLTVPVELEQNNFTSYSEAEDYLEIYFPEEKEKWQISEVYKKEPDQIIVTEAY